MYHKWQSYHVWFLRYGAQQTEFFVILDHFLPFYPPSKPENQNFEKLKNPWRYHHFTFVYHKWQSYHVWFLRYGVQQTEFFVILDHFLPFYPPSTPENQTFEKLKNPWRYHHFTFVYHKWQSYDVWFLRYRMWRTEFFVILDHFLLFHYTVPEIWHMMYVIFIFHFGLFFTPLPP